MKQIWPDYSYSPATNVLTLTGLNIDRDQLLLVAAPERGRIIYNFADSSVTASAFTSGANTALTLVASTAGLTTTASLVIYYDDQLQSTSISISNFPATQTIAGTVTADVDENSLLTALNFYATDGEDFPVSIKSTSLDIPISGTVTIGSALPAGTNRIGVVTIGNIQRSGDGVQSSLTTEIGSGYLNTRSYIGEGTAQIGSVTASISGTVPVSISSVTIGNTVTIAGTVKVDGAFLASGVTVFPSLFFWYDSQLDQYEEASSSTPLPIAGTVTVGNSVTIGSLPALAAGTAQIGSVTASISNSVTIASLPAISGTVTANSSNGSLTTRFGSVVTANEPFETSAVTNANRKYLLIQNITTASNVITVGIGFTPTTTQGIQLFAGAGLTFEGSYIPTGAVNLLSSVTASCYTILEA